MPVTNTVRAVLNSSSGRWFLWDRDGDRFEALPSNGVALTATGAGTNAVHIYRITTDNGEFKPMVATADNPATLKVYVKDPASGNMVLKEAVSCTSFADNHCEFVLAGDYAPETTKYVRLDFADGTVGGITASFSSVTLYEQRESIYQNKVGTWKALAAAVTGIDDRRVRFESSDPSICMIERGQVEAINWINVGETAIQTDQACMLVGVTKGTCTIMCTAEGDENLTAQVAVEVKVHPDDEQRPASGGTLADEVRAMLHNVRLPIMFPTFFCAGSEWLLTPDENGFRNEPLHVRTFTLTGDENDWFEITLRFTGTVLRNNWRHHRTIASESGAGIFLFMGAVNKNVWGSQFYAKITRRDEGGHQFMNLSTFLAAYGVQSARTINSPNDTKNGTPTETLDASLPFIIKGGETLVVGWAIMGTTYMDFADRDGYADIPDGITYTALMTVTDCVHHPPNEAP